MHPAKIEIDKLVTLKYPPNKPIDLLPIMNNKLLYKNEQKSQNIEKWRYDMNNPHGFQPTTNN